MRMVAAFGGSASLVLPRAVVRDLADGHAAARLMSQLMLVMGVAPILAPTLGGALLSIASWRVIFCFATLHGVVSLLLVWRLLPETLPAEQRVRLGLAALVARYGSILVERSFLLHAGVGGCAMFALFAYLGGSPPVYIQLYGLSPAALQPEQHAVAPPGSLRGAQINPRLLHRFGASVVLRWAVRLFLAAMVVLAGLAFAGGFGLLSVFLPIFVGMTCLGFVMPNATVGALSRHAGHAGSASALMGTLQFILAAISGTAVGFLTDGTARPMVALMLLGAVCAVIADAYRRNA